MTWMNEYEIEDSYDRWKNNPTMGPATATLRNFVHVVNANSDGWPYWSPASKAANQLQTLVWKANNHVRTHATNHESALPTAAQIKKSYGPIKSFMTRRLPGRTLEVIDPR